MLASVPYNRTLFQTSAAPSPTAVAPRPRHPVPRPANTANALRFARVLIAGPAAYVRAHTHAQPRIRAHTRPHTEDKTRIPDYMRDLSIRGGGLLR
jgi:hypothetical protein